MDITLLSEEQKHELLIKLENDLKVAEQQRDNDRKALKDITGTMTTEMVTALVDVSTLLGNVKKLVFDNFNHLIDMKQSIYGIREDQQSHTFTGHDGKSRITLGYRVTDNYDETASIGIAKIKKYLESLATDATSAKLMDIINSLLRKDSKNNIKVNRVLELQQLTHTIYDEDFLDGVKIITEAYKPTKSSYFIEASVKNKRGVWKNVPLSVSSVNLEI